MNKAEFISMLLGLALASSLSFAMSTDFEQELSKSDISTAMGNAKYLNELEEELVKKLPDNEDPKANLDAAAEIAKGVNGILQNGKSKAYKLFTTLFEDSYECSYQTFRSFAMNMIVVETLERDLYKRNRIRAIFDRFHKERAFTCGLMHSENYQKAIASVVDPDMERVQAAFEDIDIYDIHYTPTHSAWKSAGVARRQLMQMNLNALVNEPIPDATRKIVSNLLEEVMKTPDVWEAVKPTKDEKSGKVNVPNASQVFDDFLFRPCTQYERFAGGELSSIRLDALAFADDADFMEDRLGLYKAVIQSRFCKLALKEQSKMKKALSESWAHKAVLAAGL